MPYQRLFEVCDRNYWTRGPGGIKYYITIIPVLLVLLIATGPSINIKFQELNVDSVLFQPTLFLTETLHSVLLFR